MRKGRTSIMRLTKEHRESLKSIPLFSNVPFEFLDGWFHIIYDLGEKINSYCLENEIQPPTIQQIKEKFGTLRFYYIWKTETDDIHKDQIRYWVRAVGEASEYTCEQCGQPGKTMVDNGILKTVCYEHTPDHDNVYTMEEYTKLREEEARKRRKCDVCGEGYSDGYWNGDTHTNRCEKHKENFITSSQYFEQRIKENDQ